MTFRRIVIVMASVGLALVMMACSSAAKTRVPQVAGTYEGTSRLTRDTETPLEYPALFIVEQDGADVTLTQRVASQDGGTEDSMPLVGKIDQDGKVTVDDPPPVAIVSGCGDAETTADVVFEGVGLSLAVTTTTEQCGTLIATFAGSRNSN